MIMLTRNDKTISAYNPLIRLFPRLSISVISGKENVLKAFIYLSIYFVSISSSLKVDFHCRMKFTCARTQKLRISINPP